MHFQMANRLFYACFTTEHSFQKLRSIEYQALYKVPNFLASFHTAFLCSVLVCVHACMMGVCACSYMWKHMVCMDAGRSQSVVCVFPSSFTLSILG